jgi:hypothetical protein
MVIKHTDQGLKVVVVFLLSKESIGIFDSRNHYYLPTRSQQRLAACRWKSIEIEFVLVKPACSTNRVPSALTLVIGFCTSGELLNERYR